MRRFTIAFSLMLAPALLAGCGGGTTAELSEEQKAPDYGKKSQDKMASMYGMQDPKKPTGQATSNPAADRMRSMYGNKK